MNLIEELRWREKLYDHTEGLTQALESGNQTVYVGFDPTAPSLHAGSLLPIMGLARLQRAGHSPIALVGGGTGLVGDPSGKTQERQLLTRDQVEANAEGIRRQLSHFLDFDCPGNAARLINNVEWLDRLRLLSFLRDVGKHFSVNSMMAKESVKRRLEMEEGISYTEFTYLLLQAYDFLELFRRYGCSLQAGGSDQWGNITAGIELIRRKERKRAYGMVFPLVTTSSGVKFGKTESGAVWLDQELTSPYRFYQFWLNTNDNDVVRYLKYFTWLTREQIEEAEQQTRQAPERRQAQRLLADEVTRTVHGQTEAEKAVLASGVLFGGEMEGLSAPQIEEIFSDVPSSEVNPDRFDGGLLLTALLAESGLAASKGEAKRLIQGGGVSVNNRRVSDFRRRVTREDCVDGSFLVLRRGSKHYHLVKLRS